MKNTTKYELHTAPIARKEAVVSGEKYRFTVLTSRLIRMEYREDGKFVDEPTKTVLCREFDVPAYRVAETDDRLEIITDALHLYYDKKAFSPAGLYIVLKEGFSVSDSIWNYGDELHDLGGTARTLDNVDGATDLGHGLMSYDGFSLLDDSDSCLLTSDGWIRLREGEGDDLYFFGYGHDFTGCLKDFYHLTGPTPLLPRYAMGNWWSRFYRYSEDSYLELMNAFEEKQIPVSVSVIDMDWHITDVPKKYGSGWTGYTWNKELFPDSKRFMQSLHDMGKHITLNLHPADGVRAYEEAYLDMAKELDVDYVNEEKIPFDVTDRKFMDAYFKYLHHPQEKDGVDFWWIDWQQGCISRTKGMDPLWMLNHLHFIDSGREGKLPLSFSRYAGIGSHRYPVGFSGDAFNTWESLAFQPYFTANASNVGYTWWSHDIGGHQGGVRDDELTVRWIQYGVFSPIMRLHSTANEFYGKEPWNYEMYAEKIITAFLQLRHKLVPYLYTMNYKTHLEGIPLIRPMYYEQDKREAFSVPNQYYFGDLICCPITEPGDAKTRRAKVNVWLPEGTYYDIFTGQIYEGNTRICMYRSLDTFPVLAKAGTILPLAGDYMESCIRNPEELEVMIFNGDNGSFELYEDNLSESLNMKPVITRFSYDNENTTITMEREEDPEHVIPGNRSFKIRLRGTDQIESFRLGECDKDLDIRHSYLEETKENIFEISGENVKRFTIIANINENNTTSEPDKKDRIKQILKDARIEYNLKQKIYDVVKYSRTGTQLLYGLQELQLESPLFGAILEQITC